MLSLQKILQAVSDIACFLTAPAFILHRILNTKFHIWEILCPGLSMFKAFDWIIFFQNASLGNGI